MASDQDRRPIDKALVAATFDRAAPTYDRAAFSFFAPFADRLAERAGVRPGDRVLDVACGTGAVALAAARAAGPEGRVVAVDLSPAMVDEARAAVAAAGASVEVLVGDAESPDFPDESFDVVLCGFGIFFLPDAPAALAEWRRVLRPGGTLGLSTWDDTADERWSWERSLVREFVPRLPQSVLVTAGSMLGRFNTPEKLADALGDAGFEPPSVERTVIERVYEDPQQWWAWNQSHGNRLITDHLGEDAVAELRERGVAEAARAIADGRAGRRFSALLTTCVRPG